jgi:hypothetical protein
MGPPCGADAIAELPNKVGIVSARTANEFTRKQKLAAIKDTFFMAPSDRGK